MMTEKITSRLSMTKGQKKQLLRVLEDKLDDLELSKDELDEILKVGNLVQDDLGTSLKKHSIADKRFGPAIMEFKHTIPLDFVSENVIDQNRSKVEGLKTTRYHNPNFTSANFPNPSNKLVPGKSYMV